MAELNCQHAQDKISIIGYVHMCDIILIINGKSYSLFSWYPIHNGGVSICDHLHRNVYMLAMSLEVTQLLTENKAGARIAKTCGSSPRPTNLPSQSAINIQREHKRGSHSRDASFDGRSNCLTFKHNKHVNMSRDKTLGTHSKPTRSRKKIILLVQCTGHQRYMQVQ